MRPHLSSLVGTLFCTKFADISVSMVWQICLLHLTHNHFSLTNDVICRPVYCFYVNSSLKCNSEANKFSLREGFTKWHGSCLKRIKADLFKVFCFILKILRNYTNKCFHSLITKKFYSFTFLCQFKCHWTKVENTNYLIFSPDVVTTRIIILEDITFSYKVVWKNRSSALT